jgi:membrane fusion protein, peptide pheromone/bacteriocin exporter
MLNFIPSQLIPGTIEFYLFKISSRSQAIYLTFCIIVLMVMCSLPFVYIDVSVSAPGIITTQFEQQTLYAPSQGKIIFSRIKANEKVVRGDTLLILDSKVLSAHLGSLEIQSEENNQSINDLLLLVNMDSLQTITGIPRLITSKYKTEFESFRKKYIHQATLVNKKLRDHRRIEHLHRQDVVSPLEYETSHFDAEQENLMLGYFFRQQINYWQNDLTGRIAEQAVIEAEISNIVEETGKKYLLAPMDGTIIISTDIPIGSFLSLNQRLGELSPDADVIVSAMVFPINSGYLYEGQKVRIQIDAYNYNQWGMVEATLLDISDDILFDPIKNLPYYKVRCELMDDILIHRNGSVGRIKKGMTVNCRFIQNRENLFNLIVKRTDDWLNPSTKRN